MILGKTAAFVFVSGRWPWSCLSFNGKFANGSKILPNAFVCEPNYLQTQVFMNQRITEMCLKIGPGTEGHNYSPHAAQTLKHYAQHEQRT